jgi:hypothetical protein
MIRRSFLAVVVAAAVASSACFNFTSTVTSPSGTTGASAQLAGGWSSVNSAVAGGDTSCTNFKWSVTQTSGNTATGTFSATCFGDVAVTGGASGTLVNAVLSWTATATAVVPGITTCNISLSGTAQIVGDTIVVPYSGTTCMGSVSGTETLKR